MPHSHADVDSDKVTKSIKKHLSSKKVFLSAFFIILMSIFYWGNVVALYLKPELGPSLTSIFNTFITLCGSIIGVALTGQSFVDWKSAVSSAGSAVLNNTNTTNKTEIVNLTGTVDPARIANQKETDFSNK